MLHRHRRTKFPHTNQIKLKYTLCILTLKCFISTWNSLHITHAWSVISQLGVLSFKFSILPRSLSTSLLSQFSRSLYCITWIQFWLMRSNLIIPGTKVEFDIIWRRLILALLAWYRHQRLGTLGKFVLSAREVKWKIGTQKSNNEIAKQP
jgi:hypothetical protein